MLRRISVTGAAYEDKVRPIENENFNHWSLPQDSNLLAPELGVALTLELGRDSSLAEDTRLARLATSLRRRRNSTSHARPSTPATVTGGGSTGISAGLASAVSAAGVLPTLGTRLDDLIGSTASAHTTTTENRRKAKHG